MMLPDLETLLWLWNSVDVPCCLPGNSSSPFVGNGTCVEHGSPTTGAWAATTLQCISYQARRTWSDLAKTPELQSCYFIGYLRGNELAVTCLHIWHVPKFGWAFGREWGWTVLISSSVQSPGFAVDKIRCYFPSADEPGKADEGIRDLFVNMSQRIVCDSVGRTSAPQACNGKKYVWHNTSPGILDERQGWIFLRKHWKCCFHFQRHISVSLLQRLQQRVNCWKD